MKNSPQKQISIFKRYKTDIIGISLGLMPILLSSLFGVIFDYDNYTIKLYSAVIFFTAAVAVVGLIIVSVRANKKKIKIAYLVLIFISSLFFFSSIYYYLYALKPSNYNAAPTIIDGKLANEYEAEFHKLITINQQIYLLSELQANWQIALLAIKDYKKGIQDSLYRLDKNHRFYFSTIIGATFPPSPNNYVLHFITPGQSPIIIGDAEFSQFTSLGHPVVGDMLDQSTKEAFSSYCDRILAEFWKKQKAQSAKVGDIAFRRYNLNYIDFFYFSTITMTTTGYGDITPNSSSVRLIVVIQTVYGVMFLAFGLIIITGASRQRLTI